MGKLRGVLAGRGRSLTIALAVLAVLLGASLQPWTEWAADVARGALGGLIVILAASFIARPTVRFAAEVRVRRARPVATAQQIDALRTHLPQVEASHFNAEFQYNVRFQSASLLPLLAVAVDAVIVVPTQLHPRLTAAVPVPLSRPEQPTLRLARPSTWQLPRLALEEVDWVRHCPPDRWPSRPLDLRSVLDELNAALHVTVTATTQFFQIGGAQERIYHSGDIPELPRGIDR